MKNLIFIVLLFLTSCASRKVVVDKTDIKKDSVSETTVTKNVTENKVKTDTTTVRRIESTDEITIIPIDSTKEIYVNNVPYKNVVLKIKKNKSNTLYTNSKKESNTKRIDSVATNKTQTKERIKGKTKFIDKAAIYTPWIFWIILILILYLLWRNRQQS
jgi:ATP-dependent Zn protease